MWKFINLIRINPLLWLVAATGILTGYFREFLILFIVIFIHEIGHALAALFFKWRLVKVEMLPFGGVAEMDEYGNRPYLEEIVVTLAGPIQHLWMIGLSSLLLLTGYGDPVLIEKFISINWMILLFNLLPLWPLDGGKLLFLFLTVFLPYKRAKSTMLVASISLLFLFMISTILIYSFHLNLLIVLSFLLYAHYVEWKHQSYMYIRFLLERLNIMEKSRKKKVILVEPTMTLDGVLSKLHKGYLHEVHVKTTPPFVCNEKELLNAYFKRSARTCAIQDLFR
ncbi:site-2 protease family protein [Pseudalkalibacillus berkeleyi]|uniref:Site-2 protease family protein n=1 Tax=Pseudalkalibacillus berkeleyi TaxID=1069813 RepID=A0ABS9H1W4_9BACL|nr:site-2 protease family protein [Pseudalkalibacillus berkeleyi]MCF6138091.1 site-2 protease family protein [Pseudalkalibacillus berkeleyi]